MCSREFGSGGIMHSIDSPEMPLFIYFFLKSKY